MRSVSHKTEIAPLDGMPEKRMFWSIISDYDLKTGITELIDNAMDIWIGTKNRGALRIDLTLDAEQQFITLVDNASGVRRENLRLLIAPGGSLNSPDAESIGIFGVGSKRAVVALAEHVSIKTHHPEDGSFQVDIPKEWLESPDWELPAYAIPDIESGTTQIELSRLRKPLVQEDERIMQEHLGETYEWFLQIDNCKIFVNGMEVHGKSFDTWAYPPGYPPRLASFKVSPDRSGSVSAEIVSGLICDRDPIVDNYGVYFYCNNRLIVKELRTREVGYFITTEAGVPHMDASLCRVIVRLNGPAKLMPWNSSKTALNFGHPAFLQVRPTLIQLVTHFSKLSRALREDWQSKVFQHSLGDIQKIDAAPSLCGKKLILPPLPRVLKPRAESLKAKNKDTIQDQPWTLGLVEAVAAVDIIVRQRLETKNRIALILLDSSFEIALKEFVVHRTDLFSPREFDDAAIHALFERRHLVIKAVSAKIQISQKLLDKAKHYYELRNKLIHERATAEPTNTDIDNYRATIQQILKILFHLELE
jgi:hypothetical protein